MDYGVWMVLIRANRVQDGVRMRDVVDIRVSPTSENGREECCVGADRLSRTHVDGVPRMRRRRLEAARDEGMES